MILTASLEGLGTFKSALSAQESSISAVRKKRYSLSATNMHAVKCDGMAHVTQDGADPRWNNQKAHFARTLKKSEALQSEERSGPIVPFVKPLHLMA